MGAAAVGSFGVYDARIKDPFCASRAAEKTRLEYARLHALATWSEITDERAVRVVELATALFKESAPFITADKLFWDLDALARAMSVLQKAGGGHGSRTLCERAWMCDLSLLEEKDRASICATGLIWKKGRLLSYEEMQEVAAIGEEALLYLKNADKKRLFPKFVEIYRGLAEPEKAFSLAKRCHLSLTEEQMTYFTILRQIFYAHDSSLLKEKDADHPCGKSSSTTIESLASRVVEVPKPTFWRALFCS